MKAQSFHLILHAMLSVRAPHSNKRVAPKGHMNAVFMAVIWNMDLGITATEEIWDGISVIS